MSSVSDIKDQLVIILGAVSGVDQALDYMPRYIDKNVTIGIFYEGATFEPAEIDAHWAHYEFTITAFIYMFDETSIQETQETLGELLLSALRAKPSLNSVCLFHKVERLKNDYVQLGNGNVYATIEITMIADIEEDD
jgi:hypothetical protein